MSNLNKKGDWYIRVVTVVLSTSLGFLVPLGWILLYGSFNGYMVRMSVAVLQLVNLHYWRRLFAQRLYATNLMAFYTPGEYKSYDIVNLACSEMAQLKI